MPATPTRRYLVAADSFKRTFSAVEVAAAIGRGVRAAGAEADVHDPLRRPLRAGFGLLGDGLTAVVEVAAASGLPLLAADELDAEAADTFGSGAAPTRPRSSASAPGSSSSPRRCRRTRAGCRWGAAPAASRAG